MLPDQSWKRVSDFSHVSRSLSDLLTSDFASPFVKFGCGVNQVCVSQKISMLRNHDHLLEVLLQ